MASGALLLPPERELTIKRLYIRNMARLLAALFFWAACYKLVFLALMDSLTLWPFTLLEGIPVQWRMARRFSPCLWSPCWS